MATLAAPLVVPRTADEPTGLWSWLATTDHKRIGALYLFTALTFMLVGGAEAMIIRTQLIHPNNHLVSAETYNQIFTMHGTTMIFLVVMPLSAAFFNLLIPLQIGARDVAFPRLNAFSYWVFLFGGIFISLPILFGAGPNGGWFGYAPLTTKTYSPGLNIDFWVIGLQILGISSLAAGFNFITTIINMRAPGMNLMRMPLFTWMSFVVQFLVVLAFPVITIALVFLLFDRFFGTNFYEIAQGADPLLWQHLFWIFGHPEVYILVLPAFGLVSEVMPTFARKPLFGYPVMVYSGILIGMLGFGVWAHHMFAVGMGPIADSFFSVTTMLIAIPTGVKIFNWIFTLWGGSIRFTTAAMFAIGMVAMFTIGGISGVMHSSPPADLQQTDTYFVVAHFHYVIFGGSLMGLFAGIYYYFPKFTGRLLDERLGKWHFWVNFVGSNLAFFPMHFSGLLGMPRRIFTYDAGQGWDTFNLESSIGAYIVGIATLILAYNIWKSRTSGKISGNDPWGAGTLEWSIPSPPPPYNFAVIPKVTSRYPLWDIKPPSVDMPMPNTPQQSEAPAPTAAELGIPMPYHTLKPLFTALAIVIMFGGLMFMNLPNKLPHYVLMYGGAAMLVGCLYWWLTTPLEPEHAHS
ncbi:MAG TPA: cytochrome c oxidase subunit I [Gemmatimonadaceae bacterium]|nr:cytochrome c oxidase subunit I [Gemmatimonadaceae bacterium]